MPEEAYEIVINTYAFIPVTCQATFTKPVYQAIVLHVQIVLPLPAGAFTRKMFSIPLTIPNLPEYN